MAKKKLPFTLSDLDADATIKLSDLYEEMDDGTFQLRDSAVEWDPEKERKLNEFRESNRKLNRKKDELTEQLKPYADVDLDKYSAGLEALTKLEGVDPAILGKLDKLDEMAEERAAERVKNLRDKHESAVKAKDDALSKAMQERDRYRGELNEVVVDRNILTAIKKKGKLRPGAEEDVLARGRRVFKIGDDGKMVAEGNDGQTSYDEDGNELTPETFADELLKRASFLFESGSGGGTGENDTPNNGKPGKPTRKTPKKVDLSDPEDFGRNVEKILADEVTPASAEELSE